MSFAALNVMSLAALNVMSLAALSVMILLRKSCDMIALLTLNCPSGHHNLAKPIITAPKVHHNLPARAIIVGKKCGAPRQFCGRAAMLRSFNGHRPLNTLPFIPVTEGSVTYGYGHDVVIKLCYLKGGSFVNFHL